MRYVSDVDNLKLMMVLLKDQSRSIQFEAFHVFKVRLCHAFGRPLPCPTRTACSACMWSMEASLVRRGWSGFGNVIEPCVFAPGYLYTVLIISWRSLHGFENVLNHDQPCAQVQNEVLQSTRRAKAPQRTGVSAAEP